MTIADLLALPGMHQLTHPWAPSVILHVLAERHPSGCGCIIFAAYADVRDDDESSVAELTGLSADCDIDTAVSLLESVRGHASSWPTLTASLAGDLRPALAR